ncbi:hypothetical protein [Saccharopolyspora soli]|uniref:hypothetical protein n=1 Tax=Saccharopolyspora soli TaxID=2926618 RepID=UPI001F58353A|nr:hypothetical protein [Saccharopolyspora soli]
MADDDVGEALESLWGRAAVNTWNARRAAVLAWLSWCRDRGQDAPTVPGWTKRLATPDSETPVRSRLAIDRLVARREVALQEKTLFTCTGCSTKPPPAPRKSSGSTSRTSTSPGAAPR